MFQASTIPGVVIAKPNPASPGSAPIIRAGNATNIILKGKTIPLMLEKGKPPGTDIVMTAISAAASALASPKVPNILRGTGSPAKNTIDRQVVSHEATIELRKNNLGILGNATKPVTTQIIPQIPVPNGTFIPKETLNNSLNGQKWSDIPKPILENSTASPSNIVYPPDEKNDLLKPLNSDQSETSSSADLAELNLRCETNELGVIEVKNLIKKEAMSEDEASDISTMDLMCQETITESSPNAENNNPVVKKEPIKKEEPKVRDDEILCCGGCGCYGMAGGFYSSEACCISCHSRILQKNREKEKKERELAVQKQRREQRKKELKEAREKQQEQELQQQQLQQQRVKRAKPESEEEEEEEDEEPEEEVNKLPFDSPHPWNGNQGFSWSRYLECTNSRSAPSRLFHEAFPHKPNNFKVGQKLEAIDPEHPALVCVASIAQIEGHRLLIHFDGYSKVRCFFYYCPVQPFRPTDSKFLPSDFYTLFRNYYVI